MYIQLGSREIRGGGFRSSLFLSDVETFSKYNEVYLSALPFQRRQRRRRRLLGPPSSSLESRSLRQSPRRTEEDVICWNKQGGIGAPVLVPPAADTDTAAREREGQRKRDWDSPDRILGVEEVRVA